MQLVFGVVLAVTALMCVSGLRLNSPKTTVPKHISSRINTSAFSRALLGSTALMPSIANAAEGGGGYTAVLIPAIISVLTIFPFLYYSQALKPKVRTIKQIELDENLRAKDQKLTSGRAGVAKATKKTK